MDDVTLGGNVHDVARDDDYIRTEGEAIRLFLNNEYEISLWCSLTTTSTPVGPLQVSQRVWDAPMVVHDSQTLVDNVCSP